jgi:hypothetical protein
MMILVDMMYQLPLRGRRLQQFSAYLEEIVLIGQKNFTNTNKILTGEGKQEYIAGRRLIFERFLVGWTAG